jgi:protocatechuate 3,4-dioxygenase beta subunit
LGLRHTALMSFTETLWAKTRDILALMQMALGDPQALFDLVRPSRKQARELRAWLAPLEALVRKLLLIEAQTWGAAWTAGVPPAKPVQRVQPIQSEAKSRRDAGGPSVDAKMPSARFIFPTQRAPIDPRICKGHGPRIMLELTRSPDFYRAQKRKTHKRLCLGVRLGLRYAALIRVIENPTPFVKRLAKRIAQAPKLMAKIAAYPTPRETYLDPLLREVARFETPAIQTQAKFMLDPRAGEGPETSHHTGPSPARGSSKCMRSTGPQIQRASLRVFDFIPKAGVGSKARGPLMLYSRRRALLVLSASALAACANQTEGEELAQTPAEEEGPFYPVDTNIERDADLTRLAGRSERAAGEIIAFRGRVLGSDGRPISDARVQIWQANAVGRYAHPGDAENPNPLDPNFQGYAVLQTGADGGFAVTTIKPGGYTVRELGGAQRTPHLHWRIEAGERVLTTQSYFPGEPFNDVDFLMRAMGDKSRALIARAGDAGADGALGFDWDVVLGA